MNIRVATFNIQHGRRHDLPGDVIDLPLMARHAAKIRADVFGFNEVRRGVGISDPAFPDTPALFRDMLGAETIFGKAISLGDHKEYGNMLVSRLPVICSEVYPIPDPAESEKRSGFEPRCIIRAVIDAGGCPVTVLSTHFGLTPEERRNAVRTVLSIADETEMPIVLMGDLNAEPDDPVIRDLETVFCDTAKTLGKAGNTFPSDAPDKRIDYIFLRGCRPLEFRTEQKIVSDHYAVAAEIGLAER